MTMVSDNNQQHTNGHHHAKEENATELPPYKVKVSKRFMFVTLLSTILVAFTMGRAARMILFNGMAALLAPHDQSAMFIHTNVDGIFNGSGGGGGGGSGGGRSKELPTPKLIDGKEVPVTLYTAKNFDTSIGSASASVYLSRDSNVKVNVASEKKEECDANGAGKESCQKCSRSASSASASSKDVEETKANETHDDEEEHLPAGQHLLIDIKNVDGTFLNSEVRLAEAMVGVVNESKLTLLSYHCHKLIPMGVSCVGVLLESHISFHTWPEDGVITLDLFTCGSGELVPVLPIVKRLFGVPVEKYDDGSDEKDGYEPHMVWTHKLRGFSPHFETSVLNDDLGRFVVENASMDLKVEVGSIKTPFQRIDIWDSIDATSHDYLSYATSLKKDGKSYESLHPELFLPNREIFLDGVLQSTRLGNEAYHEALVHPAMMAHPHPQRVGIIGGGEGATLKEVLKHNTLKKVNMIEIDEKMVYFSREHLPDWNSCADISGISWCGDDPRAGMYYEDALAWFNNRYSEDAIAAGIVADYDDREPFDLLIMDALDPQDKVPFADVLYNDPRFFKTLSNALTDNGIVVLQLGESPNYSSPPEAPSRNSKRDFVMKQLAKLFHSSHVYTDGHCEFRGPWSFVIAFKGEESEALWYRNAAEIDAAIRKRMLKTVSSGANTLKYFDGRTMETEYQSPPKTYEAVYCRANPIPTSCVGEQAEDEKHDMYLARHLYKKQQSNIGSHGKAAMCNVVSNARGFAHGFGGLSDAFKQSCA